MKKWILIIFGSMTTLGLYAQEAVDNSIEMADVMRSSGKIYVVVVVLCVILTGIIIYLIQLDRKISRLEQEVDTKFKK